MHEQHRFKKSSWAGRILRRLSSYMFRTLLPQGIQRHHTSFFTEKITDYLDKDVTFTSGDRNLHVIVNSIELGDNPFAEEISIHFHVSENSSAESKVTWGARTEQQILFTSEQVIDTDMQSILLYTFTSELPFEENLSDFKEFIVNHADKAKIPPTPKSE